MAYIVSNKFREIEYSGGAIYKCHLDINGTPISPKLISRIEISDPIIDKTSDLFYIGSFISKQITIKFKNVNELGLEIESGQEVNLSIGLDIDGEEEIVPIGKFLIDNLNENYFKNSEITCIDYAIKFKPNIDYSPCFVNGKATIDTILEYICDYFQVELDENYPKTNGNVEVGSCDSTISGKQWISYIAEIKGCNAKIGRDGKLYLIPLNNPSTIEINAKKSKSFVLGERYELTRLVFDNGLTKIVRTSPSKHPSDKILTEDGKYLLTETEDNLVLENNINTMYIRSDNPFILGTPISKSRIPFTIPQIIGSSSMDNIIENIFNVVKNFEIYNLTTENYGDISLDSYDIITYKIDDKEYPTYHNSNLVYEMNISSKVDSTIPTKQQQETTNISSFDEKNRIKKLEVNYNTIDNQIVLKATDDGKLALVQLGADAEKGSEFNVKADNIKLEGYTTINNGFSIDLDGNMECNNATINGGKILLEDDIYGAPSFNIKGTNNRATDIYSNRIYMTSNYGDYSIRTSNTDIKQLFRDNISTLDNTLDNNGIKTNYWNDNGEITIALLLNDNPYILVENADSTKNTSITPNGVWSPSFNNNSQESKKKNIKKINNVLTEIINSDIVEYHWKSEDNNEKKHIGLIIADETGKYNTPSIVMNNEGNAIDLYSMCSMSWKAIQEQQEQIEELKNELEMIKNGK